MIENDNIKNRSRSKLKALVGNRRYFKATLSTIGFALDDTGNNHATWLLTHIYEVSKNGRKKAMRASDTIIMENGLKVAADHAWVDATPILKGRKTELFPNDEIKFSAIVREYPIVRDDTLALRNEIWKDAVAENERDFKAWIKAVDKYNKKYDNVKKKQAAIYEKYRRNKIDYPKMKEQQDKELEKYRNTKPEPFDNVKKRQAKRLEKAKAKQSKVKLVDYKLDSIQNVSVTNKIKLHNGWKRIKYDTNKINNIPYLKYLAARLLHFLKS